MIDSRMRATLVTVRSPNRRAITILLDNRIELGREADGIIVVDARVSRRHVALEPGPDDTVVVIDLGSANGTTLDGVAVAIGHDGERTGDISKIAPIRLAAAACARSTHSQVPRTVVAASRCGWPGPRGHPGPRTRRTRTRGWRRRSPTAPDTNC